VVPGIADEVAPLRVFQREPGWVEPKRERPFTPRERWIYRHVPGAQRAHRAWPFAQSIARFTAYDATSRAQQRKRRACLDYIRRTVHDSTRRAAVTPDYPWGCKRPVLASTFHPTLNLPHVRLVPHPVTAVTETGLVDATGAHHEADVLIMSTGFPPTRFLANLEVRGIDKQSQLERQAEVAAKAVRRLETGPGYVDTDPRAQHRWVRWIDHQIAKKANAMESGCRNYYHAPNGANITQWPGAHLDYLVATRLLHRIGIRKIAAP